MKIRGAVRNDRGFAAAEAIAGIALLLVPMFLFVATLSKWPERQAMARSAAAEAARELAVNQSKYPSNPDAVATQVAKATAEQYVRGGGDTIQSARVELKEPGRGPNRRGAVIKVTVTYKLPVFDIPFIGEIKVAQTTDDQSAEERIDDYRSFG